MDEWKALTLGDAITFVIDNRGKTPPYQLHKTPFPLVEVNAIVGDNRYPQFEKVVKYVDSEIYERWFRSGHPSSGDILFSTVGSIAEIAIVTTSQCCIAQNIVALRSKKDLVKPSFLYYLLKDNRTKSRLISLDISSVQPSIKVPHLLKIPIQLPEIALQEQISAVLSSLDDRIDLNRRTNKTLEAMARAIFKDWFVDFGPTRAKMEGRAPYLAPEIWALFPDRLDDEGKPFGWEKTQLESIFDFLEGPGIRNWQYTNTDEGCRFINIRCIQDHDISVGSLNRVSNEEAFGKYNHFQLSAGDFIVSTSGTLGRWALVREAHLPLMLNTSVIRFRPKSKQSSTSFLWQYLDSQEFALEIENRASGSVQKNFGPMHLKQMSILYPGLHLVEYLEKNVSPLFKLWKHNLDINCTLAQTRDLLLPKLLSGEIRVKDAEKTVGAVL